MLPSGLLRTVKGTPQDRLTRVQVLFTRNLSPLQSSKFPFEYLLLPPRSALGAAPRRLTPDASPQDPHALLLIRAYVPAQMVRFRSPA